MFYGANVKKIRAKYSETNGIRKPPNSECGKDWSPTTTHSVALANVNQAKEL